MKWAWERGEKLIMLPDQHLGRNTAYKMGVPLDEMVVWDPNEIWGGLDPEQVQRLRAHLKLCGVCRTECAALAQLRQQLIRCGQARRSPRSQKV